MYTADNGRLFAFAKPELLALSRVMSRDPARVNLNALWIDAAAATAWACDGHRILLGTADGGSWQEMKSPVGVPAENVAAVLKAARARDVIAFSVDAHACAVKILDGSRGAPTDDEGMPIKERFSALFPLATVTPPPAASIVPRYEESPPATPAAFVGVNPTYIAALGDLAKIGGDRTIPVVWYHAGELDPFLAVYRCDDGAIWRSVIMPMRLDR